MKMAGVCEIVLLLLWVTSGSSGCDMYATTGKNFTVELDYQVNGEKLRWKHNDTIIVDLKGTKFNKGSQNDINQNGSLKLTNVQKSHSGNYTPEVFAVETGKSVKDFKTKNLCVLDPVPKPTVTQKCSTSKTDVVFTCNVGQKTDGYTFKWLQDGKEIKENQQNLKRNTKPLGSTPISCIVTNKANEMTSDPVKQECVESGFVFPEEVLGVSVWVFVAGGGGIVIVLILLTIVCCIQTKRKKSMRIKDEEELRLGWTNTQQQQHQHQHQHQHNHPPEHPHRHHHHHHQQQPAGHTGPRQQRTKHPRPRAPDPTNGQPKPNPRRAQPPKPPNDDDDQPPPLPQPRKKGPKTPKM